MSGRLKAIQTIGSRPVGTSKPTPSTSSEVPSEGFGSYVFNRTVMQRLFPKEIYNNVVAAMEGREKIRTEYADIIASTMKDWAVSLGATHFTHWFQPLTGLSAAKHDAFIDWHVHDSVIEKFGGKQLLQGEPDASSLPSGGLRSTFEARGYTAWDPTSPIFIWKTGGGATLCIPSIFFSWTGEALDHKLPLLRAENKLGESTLRLLKLSGIKAKRVYTTLGFEQEYFLVDRSLRDLRPDLMLTERTLFGAAPAKGQQLQDHYIGAVRDRVIHYMHDFESTALHLGIPVKTRHNEVAPAQHEVAPVFERASSAVDHNILLMELMRVVAGKHKLTCLLHEKPFAALNGSGKHANWSLMSDTGLNLFDPTAHPENNWPFLTLVTAVLHAAHRHPELLRSSIGSASNDLRLGGHEAPPAIISVYLGTVLERLLSDITKNRNVTNTPKQPSYDLGSLVIPDLPRDHTDRNRTSPFAFTGNRFEFRAVGSSSNPSFPITILNSIVAESLNEILDEIEKSVQVVPKKPDQAFFGKYFLPVLRKYLKVSEPIRFSGDNYSAAWVKEAQKRKIPNTPLSIDSYKALITKKSKRALEGVLNAEELECRYQVLCEAYAHTHDIETDLMAELFLTHVLPAATRAQKDLAQSITSCTEALNGTASLVEQKRLLKALCESIEKGCKLAKRLEQQRAKANTTSQSEARGRALRDNAASTGNSLREVVDAIEDTINDKYWPLPKYREILFNL